MESMDEKIDLNAENINKMDSKIDNIDDKISAVLTQVSLYKQAIIFFKMGGLGFLAVLGMNADDIFNLIKGLMR